MDGFLFGLPLAIWVGIISAVTGLISATLTYFLGVLKTKRDLLSEYDKKILEERLIAYRELWKLFLPFARYQPQTKITYQALKKISMSMSDWYYTVGGIFLTNDSRDEYFDVQNYLQEVIRQEIDENDELDRNTIDNVFNKGSILRTKLTKELGSRTNFHSTR